MFSLRRFLARFRLHYREPQPLPVLKCELCAYTTGDMRALFWHYKMLHPKEFEEVVGC